MQQRTRVALGVLGAAIVASAVLALSRKPGPARKGSAETDSVYLPTGEQISHDEAVRLLVSKIKEHPIDDAGVMNGPYMWTIPINLVRACRLYWDPKGYGTTAMCYESMRECAAEQAHGLACMAVRIDANHEPIVQ